MKVDYFNKSINHTEKSMGFISLSKNESLMFPNIKTKINIKNPLFPKEGIVCTFDPKHNRIYGLRSLLKKCKENSILVKRKSEKDYLIDFK